MKRYPLKLTYIAKSAIWGGKKLMNDWGKESADDIIAETWELSVRRNEMARVTNGEASGMTLAEYIDACGADCVSPEHSTDKPFPLLIKFIDAADHLSVQVHPDDEYAASVESDVGKTEMWYIVDAEPGAHIVCGLAEGVGRDELAAAVSEGRTGEAMRYIPVSAGESYFIPAGMIHAIGAGILIAEIQQNSDLTYRVYDYDRVGADGKKRELHVKKALDVTRPWDDGERDAVAFVRGRECADGELLANSRYFSVVKRTVREEKEYNVGKESFEHILCVGGEGYIVFEGETYPISRGDSYYLPANMGEYKLGSREGKLEVICSKV